MIKYNKIWISWLDKFVDLLLCIAIFVSYCYVFCLDCILLFCILSLFYLYFFAFDHSWLFVKIAFLLTFSFSSFMVNIRLFVREKITRIVIFLKNFFRFSDFFKKKSQFDEKSTKIVMFLQTSHFFVMIPHFFFIWSTL